MKVALCTINCSQVNNIIYNISKRFLFMVLLNNSTTFPSNSEWAYLYAVADVYKNYSCKNKNGDSLYDPHPLKDKEVVQILSEKYNLSNIHRNTIANVREKLSTYFGFIFETYKKGKYYVGQNNSISDDDLSMIIMCIKFNRYISSDYKNRLVSFLMSMSSDNISIKKTSERIRMSANGYDLKETILFLLDAINTNATITFDYPNQSNKLTRKPTKIRDCQLECSDKYVKMYEPIDFDIRKMKNITIIKRKNNRTNRVLTIPIDTHI